MATVTCAVYANYMYLICNKFFAIMKIGQSQTNIEPSQLKRMHSMKA